MRVAIVLSLVSVVAVCLVATKAEQVERTLQSKDKIDEEVGRILGSSDRGTGNSGGKLASWSKLDPESDVVRPKNMNREGREGRKGKKGLLGKVRKALSANDKNEENSETNQGEEEGEGGENGRRLNEESTDARSEAEQKRADMERRREELRAQKQKEIRDRYKNRDTGDFDPERYMRERDARSAGRAGDVGAFEEEDYLSERHKELRDRHRTRDRERAYSRDRSSSGRRDRKRPESEGRHAVLRRRIDKHAHLFSPEELAEIEDDLREHKKREDKLDAARDKLNAQFDAVRDIDDRDARLGRLEQLKNQRAAGRDAERAARDQLREDFQLIREKLEAKLRTDLRK